MIWLKVIGSTHFIFLSSHRWYNLTLRTKFTLRKHQETFTKTLYFCFFRNSSPEKSFYNAYLTIYTRLKIYPFKNWTKNDNTSSTIIFVHSFMDSRWLYAAKDFQSSFLQNIIVFEDEYPGFPRVQTYH